jgi:hypothetical protein
MALRPHRFTNVFDMLKALGFNENSSKDGVYKGNTKIPYDEVIRGVGTGGGAYTPPEFLEKMKKNNWITQTEIDSFSHPGDKKTSSMSNYDDKTSEKDTIDTDAYSKACVQEFMDEVWKPLLKQMRMIDDMFVDGVTPDERCSPIGDIEEDDDDPWSDWQDEGGEGGFTFLVPQNRDNLLDVLAEKLDYYQHINGSNEYPDFILLDSESYDTLERMIQKANRNIKQTMVYEEVPVIRYECGDDFYVQFVHKVD